MQGLAARKVTAGSPLNSCKLSAGSGEAGAESTAHGFGRIACTGLLFVNTPPPPFPVWKEFFCWMLEAVEGSDYIVIRPGLRKSARLLVFLLVLVAGR